MKLLVISDTHIPSRNHFDISDFLENKDYDLLIHCGDFDTTATYETIKKIAWNRLYCVHGNSDEYELKNTLPEMKFWEIDKYKMMIAHWHQVSNPRWNREWLVNIALENDAKILFCWHTHRQEIYKYKDWIFLPVNEIKLDDEKCTYVVNPGTMIRTEFLEIIL